MNYLDSAKGANTQEVIARSLMRIADALEENNRLMAKILSSGETGKRIASQSDAARKAMEELIP